MYEKCTVMLQTISFHLMVVGINIPISKLIVAQMKDLSYQWEVLCIDEPSQ